MKLVETKDLNTPVRIHNDIASGRGDFSACMLDVLFYILSDFKKDERFYTIRAQDIMELTGREWQYQQFREATEAIGSRMFEIETDNSLLQLWLFGSVEYKKGTGSFEIEVSQKAMPFLQNLKMNFTSMQLKSLMMCSSKYAKRLYMLGCRWRSAGRVPKMTIDELKIMLGLKDKNGKNEQYERFSQFKKCVLDVARQQINEHTDIMIDYHLHKRGRSYYWIDILINYQACKQLELDFGKPIEVQKSTQTIMKYGFNEEQAVAIAKQGMKEFNQYIEYARGKVMKKEMKVDELVPYIVKIYQKKGILIHK
ncbi:RepB family plasmid replication initiator protein [Ornithobacterium rhinotracheale]|uniref:replication initiation protein n=1 Tax=Ornithobacterium rhinotracheale TaxID=28251 RepID=UPI00129C629D|nr:replication initiation protein [Ornithobacterium rhinotracheale]MRJ11618.1 RepB family plasmid replication initiator protein [Ornithobacterium rhinotracheale]